MSALVRFPFESYTQVGSPAFKSFAPKAGFTIENARAMMWFAQLAYEADLPKKIAAIQQSWAFTNITPFIIEQTGIEATFETYGIIGERTDAVLVAFGGTDPLVWQTLATDFTFKKSSNDVHRGFEAAGLAAGSHVAQAVTRSKELNVPLFLTAHSLGAAVAAVAALGTPPDVRVEAIYTFGMPRTGGEAFKARYDARLGERTYRLVHGRDLVATVPPSVLPIPSQDIYRHVGRLLWCGPGKTFNLAELLGSTNSDEPNFAPGLVKTIIDFGSSVLSGQIFSPAGLGTFGPLFKFLPLNVRDHLQDRYLHALGVNVIPES